MSVKVLKPSLTLGRDYTRDYADHIRVNSALENSQVQQNMPYV